LTIPNCLWRVRDRIDRELDMISPEFAAGYWFPDGLAIHIDACKGLETTIEDVFPRVEYRECMRHLAAHFKLQGFKGQLFDDNI
jgi:hypothetical protein